ncbi:putative HAD superfamily hydrolase [Taphrina deformans PYCC 5710]|uniref:HAD superfamily hydrolase n=1 Tax=Taphrina deformans (strain PYCC 5710 / ATCC 11124 / CBS 356.35 / IMI 108563 / JCM 9778 / NBRC 8474) TaxID=1097556 RepID=R4XAG4_TAPDE|nr:putative HAD superfamily hydrolase [Taphrina deformans PYCC 5710]|eukprot:CCG82757.1 putative HAD superfamily hydrolase [Taphrina deformans PYCC 5710]
MPTIKACLFDMDGLLIDSERIYTLTTEQVLRDHGREPHFPALIKSDLMGRPGPEAATLFLRWAGLEEELGVEGYLARQATLQRALFPSVAPMPGAAALLDDLVQRRVELALATSSTTQNFHLKTSRLQDLFRVFGGNVICGDDERVRGRGKPEPDIFVHALEDINRGRRSRGQVEILPDECLVLEDGVPGVTAGLRAGNHVLWVPDEQILALHHDQVDQILGEKGKMVHSLEDFPWEYYGLK